MGHIGISTSLCCSHQDPEQLFQACEQGDLEVVHRFLAANIDVDIRDTVSLELVLRCIESGVVIDINIFITRVTVSEYHTIDLTV